MGSRVKRIWSVEDIHVGMALMSGLRLPLYAFVALLVLVAALAYTRQAFTPSTMLQ